MSINVTVTGNPVNIKRGKMVTTDPYHSKKEFEKRRLLRLEQVRQQSKDLAEDVRNKVKREKRKQLGDIEQEGKEKLKNWQNRKLLELQSQFKDALDEIGLGHKEAEELDNEHDTLEERRMENEEKAKNRGKLANTKLQIDKNKENYQKAMPAQQKQLARDIENTRAALVSSMKTKTNKYCKKQKKKYKSADINITVPDDSDFSEDMPSDSSHLQSIPEEQSESSEGFCECLEKSEESTSSFEDKQIKKTDYFKPQLNEGNDHKKSGNTRSFEHKLKTRSLSVGQKPLEETIDKHRKHIEDFRNETRAVPLDTRISDRIKCRELMASQPDLCDLDIETSSMVKVGNNQTLERNNSKFKGVTAVRTKDILELTSDECACEKLNKPCVYKTKLTSKDISQIHKNIDKDRCCCDHCRECNKNIRDVQSGAVKQSRDAVGVSKTINSEVVDLSSEVPSKPAVTLKGFESSKKSDPVHSAHHGKVVPEAHKVRHYDHANRFVQELPSMSQVEKVSADSVVVNPNVTSEEEVYKKMKQRDKEAQVRGKKALEKEKLQRDYEEMMKQLPILQRKEHIAQIGIDKPEYHMSKEQLQERERERQTNLENAYTRIIPELKPKIVTIPSQKPQVLKTDEPFEILDGDDARTINLGKWDVDKGSKKKFSLEEVQEIIKSFTIQKPEDRRAKLKHLLKSLKLQKEELINEIKMIPKDDSIAALISDLNSFSDSDKEHYTNKKRRKSEKERRDRKRQHEETDTSNTIISEAQTRADKLKEYHKGKHGGSPRKRAKKSKVLILQNTSTQTTPMVKGVSVVSNGDLRTSPEIPSHTKSSLKSVHTCKKLHVPCDCDKKAAKESSEELCKIFIKLHDSDNPQVELIRNPRNKEKESEMGDMTGRKKLISQQEERKSKSPKSPKSPTTEKEKALKSPKKDETKSSTAKKKLPEIPKSTGATSASTKHQVIKPDKKKAPGVTSSKRSSVISDDSRRQNRNESWKEHLSKNSISTSSTSYLSPPDFSKLNFTSTKNVPTDVINNLRKKPHHRNIHVLPSRQIPVANTDLSLINYVKRLLSMSKASVEDLGVSSSDVQTPSQSVVEIESNIPLAALYNIKLLNLKAAEINRALSISSDERPVPPNSTSNIDDYHSKEDKSQYIPEKDTNDGGLTQTQDSIQSQYADVTDSCSKRIANLAHMIEKLRQEKIQMLQSPPISQKLNDQVSRDEFAATNVDPLLTPTFSDKDNTTKYLDLPREEERSRGSSSPASIGEEELNRRLLEIDMCLAEKLKMFRAKDDKSRESSETSDKIAVKEGQPAKSPKSDDLLDQADQDFLRRLQKLIEESHEKEQTSRNQSPNTSQATEDAAFEPLLLSIPKLPILEPQDDNQTLHKAGGPGRRRPPPSKGLTVAKKFNGHIALVPHELSTIIEADSQISTKISPNNTKTSVSYKDTQHQSTLSIDEKHLDTHRSQRSVFSNDKPKESPNGQKSKDDSETAVTRLGQISPTKEVKSDKEPLPLKPLKFLDLTDYSKSLSCNEGTCTSLCSSTSSSKKSLTSSKKSSSSSSDMESIEAMLRSIGMDWAISTLHKTQEALALTSTSSSGDLSSKRKNSCRSTSSSEVSLKEFLKKQMLNKISSSSLKSDGSPASFMQELAEISAIIPNISNSDRGKQRTSTPVLSGKNTKEEQNPFGQETSDISIVRNVLCDILSDKKSSGKQTFYSLGDEDSSLTKNSTL